MEPTDEIRCKKCNRLLMKGTVVEIEIKCPKCGYLNFILHDGVFMEGLEVVHDMMNA